MKNSIKHTLLFSIVLLAIVIRFVRLGEVPVSPDWDEVALGYNAYSILKTGRDEFGTRLPLVLRSYDDYKPPLYAYLSIPSIALFGLTVQAVRLPSAVFGVLAVLGTYILVVELFALSAHFRNVRDHLGLLSAFLLSISPWHIQFSRIAFEANIGVTLNIWALVCFFKGLKSPRMLFVSSFLFGLALYAYHSERIFVPLIVIALAILFRPELVKIKRAVVTSAIIGFLVVLPLVPVLFNPTTLTRLRGTSAFIDPTTLLSRSVQKLIHDQETGNPWGIVFDNRRVVYVQKLIDNYLAHFSVRWLFLTGDNDRHHAPDSGLLYLWELPFLLWGIYRVFGSDRRTAAFLFSWFLIAPVPASPTSEVPHAIRTLNFLPTFQIFTALGVYQFLLFLRERKTVLWKIFGLGVYGIALFFTVRYFNLYFVHLNREFSQYWQYGYRQAVEYVRAREDQYEKIVVSTKLEQPHMFFLFYLKYDPSLYLSQGGTQSGGFAEVRNRFDKYEFRPLDWNIEVTDGSTLYVGHPLEIWGDPRYIIKYLDGTDAIKITDR